MQPREHLRHSAGVKSIPLNAGHVRVEDSEEDNAVFDLLYEYETVHLGRRSFSRDVRYAGTPAASIYREEIGGTSHNLGAMRGDRIALCIPLVDTQSSWWGLPLNSGIFPAVLSGQTIHFTYHNGHQNLVIAVDRSVCEAAWTGEAGKQGGVYEAALATARQRLVTCPPQRIAAWARRLQNVLQTVTQEPTALSPQTQTGSGLQNEVLTAMRSLLENGRVCEVEQPTAKMIVEEALERGDALNRLPSVADLCVAANVSRRTLELAFRRVTGSSPRQFLAQRQLNRSFCLLKQASAESTRVTDVAMSCGFQELGRFAVRYKKAFGETPRDTLRTRVGRVRPKVLGSNAA